MAFGRAASLFFSAARLRGIQGGLNTGNRSGMAHAHFLKTASHNQTGRAAGLRSIATLPPPQFKNQPLSNATHCTPLPAVLFAVIFSTGIANTSSGIAYTRPSVRLLAVVILMAAPSLS